MSKCNGCGVVIQTTDVDNEGYAKENSLICERCFRIKNYNEYKKLTKENVDFIEILNKVNQTNDLVVLVIDALNVTNQLDIFQKYLKNEKIIVFNKRDLLPLSLSSEKIITFLDKQKILHEDIIITSSKKNTGLDELMESIRTNKKSNNVSFVGFTNAGKSSLINKIIYNYTNQESTITTSFLPSTTLSNISIKIDDDLILNDTPGLLDKGNIVEYINEDMIKKIIPKKEIKPITYNIKSKQSFFVEDFLYLMINEKTSITFFMSNNLSIKRMYKEVTPNGLEKYNIVVNRNEDLVIEGLGFIKNTKKTTMNIYVPIGVKVFTRESLI